MQTLVFFLLLAMVSVPNALWGGSAEDIGKPLPSESLKKIDQLDVDAYDNLLSKYVDSNGGVNYQAWHASTIDRKQLQLFLFRHSIIDPSAGNKDQRLALWINAYNALTLEGILREYPTDSIRNHTAKLFGYNVWDDLRLYVGGEAYSLNAIEHEILRKMDEPRIHFAIVCASTGCPRLINEAYRSETLDTQLTGNAQNFFENKQNFKVDGNAVYLSSILDWFGEDFGDNTQQVLQRISPWLPSSAKLPKNANVRYTDYDWSLNSQK